MRGLLPVVLLRALCGLLACSDVEHDPDTEAPSDAVTDSADSADSAEVDEVDVTPEPRVVAYTLAIDLATGRVASRVTVADAGACVQLKSRNAVQEVTWNGMAPSRSAWQDGVLEVCGPAATRVEIGGAVLVTEEPFGELGLRRRAYGVGEMTSLLAWIEGCDRFGPCDPRTDALVDVALEVTHAAGETVLCPGALDAGETLTRCTMHDVPTYAALTVAAHAGWVRTPFVDVDGLAVVLYERPEGKLASRLARDDVRAFLRFMVAHFGAFPWGDELRVAAAPIGWLGFEPPAQILLQSDLGTAPSDYANPALHTLIHEIAHQWAGVRTTLATPFDIVWKEAAAEYLAWVYEDEHRPAAEAAQTVAFFDRFGTLAAFYPRPADVPPPPLESVTAYAYGVGPMALFVQLEGLLGRAAVLAGLEVLLAEPGARSIGDWLAAVERTIGVDLEAYAAAWIDGSGEPLRPSFAVRTEAANGNVTVIVTQDRDITGVVFPCVVEVELRGVTRSERVAVDFGLAPTSSEARATIAFDEPVVSATIDPRHRVMSWR